MNAGEMVPTPSSSQHALVRSVGIRPGSVSTSTIASTLTSGAWSPVARRISASGAAL